MLGKWHQSTIEKVAPFSYGKGLPERIRNASGSVPVFGSNGVVGFHNESLTQGPTVIIGRKGTVGVVSYSPIPCWPIDTTFFISGLDEALMRYRFYLLKSLGLEHMNSDSAVPGLNRNAAHARIVSIPFSETEQRAIAYILGTLDDKIELNRQMNATLAAMAKALFKSWFVDFDPVRAKVDGRWKPGQSLPGLPAQLYDVFPNHLVDSDFGKIPAGWQIKPLDEIAEFLNGLALQKYSTHDFSNSLPVIKIAELRNGISSTSNRASREIPQKYIVQDGDFLFSWSGSLLAKFWTGGKGALNQHLFNVTSNEYPMWFVSQWVLHHLSEFQSIAASKATTMGHIQRGHLKSAMTVCSPQSALTKLGKLIAPLVERSIQNSLEMHNLANLRDTLFPKLISGEIQIKDAERIIGDAT